MSIAHPTHEFYYTKKFDDNKVPFVEIHFQLHHQDNQTLAKVKALFPGTQLTESNTAKLITIDNITIDQVIKLANLETLLSHAKTIPQHIQTVIATEKEVYPRDKTIKQKKIRQQQPHKHWLKIVSSTSVYLANTIHQHLTIVSIPLPLAKQKTQSTVKKTHLFIVNELKDPILDKIADKIDNATFATKRGQQGLVPWPFHEEMQDNHWKPCAMKLKVFDKELDCRVWLTAHHDTTGEHTLFVAEGLKNEVT